jgi:RNA polymerase-binding transcription factor DksA
VTIISREKVDLNVTRRRLEGEYERHTQQLNQLGASRQDNSDALLNVELRNALRRALSDITVALHAMAEGRYGVCGACRREISVERLRLRPQAKYCPPCQRAARVAMRQPRTR